MNTCVRSIFMRVFPGGYVSDSVLQPGCVRRRPMHDFTARNRVHIMYWMSFSQPSELSYRCPHSSGTSATRHSDT
jgi:hypothetical protein